MFGRYPQTVHWDTESIPSIDQEKFRDIWKRLKEVAIWLAATTDATVPMRPFTSHPQPNGRSPRELWCCVYPESAPNKSYTLQIALIISSAGAELSLCLGAGRSQLRGPELIEAQQVLENLQARMSDIPQAVIEAVEGALPVGVAYRKSWLQPADTRDFKDITQWLAYASTRAGAGASISINLDPAALEHMGDGVVGELLDLAEAAGPLLRYCFPQAEPPPDQSAGSGGQTQPDASETITIGGVAVTAAQIADAIEILKNAGGTAVRAPLQAKGNPLSAMDYHQVAEAYLQAHPEAQIPAGSPEQHAAHVKTALIARLEEHLSMFGTSPPPSTSQASFSAPHVPFDADMLEERALAHPSQLQIDRRVYRAVVAAIRSGKHVILTGPPGTAKTTLAELTCQLASEAGLCSGHTLTTATSDWTTYETIGGLRPAQSGGGLHFQEGIFLEAARSRRWLLVDELNRSNFDRAFGQLFTVLSGQAVVLPYEDARSGRRIVLIPEGAASKYDSGDYERLVISNSWRIVATMNVFDKSLLFEMSFALMRRFAFIEVPSPAPSVFAKLWQHALKDLPAERAQEADQVLQGLLNLRSVKDIGPAVFLDMARFAGQYIDPDVPASAHNLAFQLFFSYLLPQFEGVSNPEGVDLYRKVRKLVGAENRDRLRTTITQVLGVVLESEAVQGDEVSGSETEEAGSSSDTFADTQ